MWTRAVQHGVPPWCWEGREALLMHLRVYTVSLSGSKVGCLCGRMAVPNATRMDAFIDAPLYTLS